MVSIILAPSPHARHINFWLNMKGLATKIIFSITRKQISPGTSNFIIKLLSLGHYELIYLIKPIIFSTCDTIPRQLAMKYSV